MGKCSAYRKQSVQPGEYSKEVVGEAVLEKIVGKFRVRCAIILPPIGFRNFFLLNNICRIYTELSTSNGTDLLDVLTSRESNMQR